MPPDPRDADPFAPPEEREAARRAAMEEPAWLARFRRDSAGQLHSWQFRLSHLLWLTLLVAVGSALGVMHGHDVYVLSVGVLVAWVYLFAPVLAVAVTGLWPGSRRKGRVGIRLAFACLMVAAVFLLMVGHARLTMRPISYSEFIIGVKVCLMPFWGLQLVMLWLMARKARRDREFRARMRPPTPESDGGAAGE
jgi:hypothetical protein